MLGTRPEIIKMSPIIRECQRRGIDYSILHTGQHYSYNMDRVFFEQLQLPDADFNLDVGSGSHAMQTARMMIGIEEVLEREAPDVVLVEGDTNTVLAGALTAYKMGVKVGHVEAGLRSYDRRMPEEVNRVLADHCSDYMFAPTENSRNILLGEGIDATKIFVTGNTIVDAVHQNLGLSERRDVLGEHGLEEKGYFLTTVHRQENVDDEGRFSSILRGLELLSEEYDLPCVYPAHPRAVKMMKRFSLTPNLRLIDPVDYLSFLQLEKNAKLILTDSGGIQEEACILRVPCVTLRDNTERPETIEVGSNVVSGTKPQAILEKSRMMLEREPNWGNPFGDGNAAHKIIQIIYNDFTLEREHLADW